MREDSPDDAVASPNDVDRQGTARSRPQQRALLTLAMIGLMFAGWYAWNARDRWMTLVDPHYGDPFVAAYERFDLSGEQNLPGYVTLGAADPERIPALTDPLYVELHEAGFLDDSDRVIGISADGTALAFPLKIMQWHEAVNTSLDSTPVLVTYCPLCDSATVFDRRIGGREREFGPSGFLYNNNLSLYDVEQEGKPRLWSQMHCGTITGLQAPESMHTLPVELTSWQSWRSRHPGTRVLSINTGFDRNYEIDAYQEYFESAEMPVNLTVPVDGSWRVPNKDRVLGIWTSGLARAYPISSFAEKDGVQVIADRLGEHEYTVIYDPHAHSLRVDTTTDEVHWVYALYFAWYGFHPETEVYEPDPQS